MSTTEALGLGRTIEDHFQEMADLFTRRIDTAPEDANHYLSRAKCYIQLEDQEGALADLEKYADIIEDPSQAAAEYGNLGWPLVSRPQEMVNPEIAVELYRKAHEMERENWRYLRGLGMAHYLAGQWEEAISALTKSTELPGGEHSRNFLFLAMAHWQSGNKAAAANWYNKAIELVQKSNIDIVSLRRSFVYTFYLEAAELMGIKVKEFYRKAPLTGKQVPAVTARADSSHLDMTVEHILDGSGLADGDGDGLLEHGETPEDMWLSGEGRTRGWVEFDLGRVYELGSILVWNYNERGRTKRGVKKADISVWTQDSGWQRIFDDFEFDEAEGSFDYDEPILVKFDGVKAQKVRFDDLANLGDEEYVGLSEVRFFQRRGPEAIRPHPADGADIGVPMEAKLSWTPGEGVKAHRVYFGSNPDSPKYMGKVEAGDTSEVKLPKLEKCQRYWWRVDAEKSDGSMIKGKLWSFLTGRMVGWWKFDNEEGSTIAVDSSGYYHHGTLYGDPCWVSGATPESGALEFDGDGDYVQIVGYKGISGGAARTVAFWMQMPPEFPDNATMVSWGGTTGAQDGARFDIKVRSWGSKVGCLRVEVQGGATTTDMTVNDNQWHHIAVVVPDEPNVTIGDVEIYIDGELQTNTPYTRQINTGTDNDVLIGDSFWGDRWYQGLLDDVRIYSYALSEAEIKALYAGRGPGPTK